MTLFIKDLIFPQNDCYGGQCLIFWGDGPGCLGQKLLRHNASVQGKIRLCGVGKTSGSLREGDTSLSLFSDRPIGFCAIRAHAHVLAV